MTKYQAILLMGPKGAGKTTACQQLSERRGYIPMPVNDIYRSPKNANLAEQVRIYRLTSRHALGDPLMMEMITSEIDRHIATEEYNEDSIVCIDGFPKFQREVASLEARIEVRSVLFLDTREETSLARVRERAKTRHRIEDTNESYTLLQLGKFYAHTMPVIQVYEKRGLVTRIDANTPFEEVYVRIAGALDNQNL